MTHARDHNRAVRKIKAKVKRKEPLRKSDEKRLAIDAAEKKSV
jgi:hypothetical protein